MKTCDPASGQVGGNVQRPAANGTLLKEMIDIPGHRVSSLKDRVHPSHLTGENGQDLVAPGGSATRPSRPLPAGGAVEPGRSGGPGQLGPNQASTDLDTHRVTRKFGQPPNIPQDPLPPGDTIPNLPRHAGKSGTGSLCPKHRPDIKVSPIRQKEPVPFFPPTMQADTAVFGFIRRRAWD